MVDVPPTVRVPAARVPVIVMPVEVMLWSNQVRPKGPLRIRRRP